MVSAKFVSKLLLPILCSSCAAVSNELEGINFTAGIMQRHGTEARVVKEVFEIPFITISEDPNYGFGYRIDTGSKQLFRHRVLLHIQEQSNLTGDIPSNIKYSDQIKTVAYPEEEIDGFTHLFMRLDKNDPLGVYEVESYINGKLYKKIRFNVVAKGEEPH